ncbi:MAG: hypothetical protein ACREKJ_03200 [Candidatus Rokuibacteriota bacterium]
MNDIALLITFARDGRIRCYPILDVAEHGLELADRLHRLCHALIESPDTRCCRTGWHEHPAGSCPIR